MGAVATKKECINQIVYEDFLTAEGGGRKGGGGRFKLPVLEERGTGTIVSHSTLPIYIVLPL